MTEREKMVRETVNVFVMLVSGRSPFSHANIGANLLR